MAMKMELTRLAPILQLRKLAQAIAALDSVLMPEWQFRYYSYQRDWSESVDLFSMRDGSGDEFIIIFQPEQTLIKGFAHESPLSPHSRLSKAFSVNLLEELPMSFAPLLTEKAFLFQETTFCLWRTQNDEQWSRCKTHRHDIDVLDDGSTSLLYILDGDPKTYHHWATGYYGLRLTLNTVTAMYRHQPLTEALANEINPLSDWQQVVTDMTQIGYPIGSSSAMADG